jgi:hypothetical protein
MGKGEGEGEEEREREREQESRGKLVVGRREGGSEGEKGKGHAMMKYGILGVVGATRKSTILSLSHILSISLSLYAPLSQCTIISLSVFSLMPLFHECLHPSPFFYSSLKGCLRIPASPARSP